MERLKKKKKNIYWVTQQHLFFFFFNQATGISFILYDRPLVEKHQQFITWTMQEDMNANYYQ